MEDAGSVDTRNIKLPEELLQLTERLAANVHQRWVQQRLAEGWRSGARIEPKTPPGQVYASENFAAIAAAQKITDFRCEYVGRLPLAKGYGTFGTYHVAGRDYRS